MTPFKTTIGTPSIGGDDGGGGLFTLWFVGAFAVLYLLRWLTLLPRLLYWRRIAGELGGRIKRVHDPVSRAVGVRVAHNARTVTVEADEIPEPALPGTRGLDVGADAFRARASFGLGEGFWFEGLGAAAALARDCDIGEPSLPPGSFARGDGQTVSVFAPRPCADDGLREAVRFAAALAASGAVGRTALRAIPGAHWVEDSHGGHARLDEGQAVRVFVRSAGGRVCTEARVGLGAASRWRMQMQGADTVEVLDGAPPSAFTHGGAAELGRLGVVELAAHGGCLRARWAGIERDPGTLGSASKKLARLAGSTGTYR